MHELPIIKTVFRNVLEYANRENAEKVNKVYLEVGVLRDFVPELMKKYWAYIVKGSIAEGSTLLLRELPAVAKCGQCGEEYQLDVKDVYNNKCPKCGFDKGALIKGRELIIYSIEIKNKEAEHAKNE